MTFYYLISLRVFLFHRKLGAGEAESSRKFKVGLKNGPTFGIQSISIFLDVDKVEQVEEQALCIAYKEGSYFWLGTQKKPICNAMEGKAFWVKNEGIFICIGINWALNS